MTDVRTQHVIDALTELGFERRAANDSHALYAHRSGASVSLPHSRPLMPGALLKAIERQVIGFGIASARAFAEKVHPTQSFDANAGGTDGIDADTLENNGKHSVSRQRIAAK